MRRKFLEERAQAWADTHEQDKAKRLKSIIHTEDKKKIHGRIKFLRNRVISLSLSKITVSKNGQDKIIDDPDSMERMIIQRNIKHFSQANNAPFASDALIKLIGRTATNKKSRQDS